MHHCCVRKLVWLLEELQWLRNRLEHDREQHQLQITYLCRQNQNLALAAQQHVHLWVGLPQTLSAVCVCVCLAFTFPTLVIFFQFIYFAIAEITSLITLTSLNMRNELLILFQWTVSPDFLQCMLGLSTYLFELSLLHCVNYLLSSPRLAMLVAHTHFAHIFILCSAHISFFFSQ